MHDMDLSMRDTPDLSMRDMDLSMREMDLSMRITDLSMHDMDLSMRDISRVTCHNNLFSISEIKFLIRVTDRFLKISHYFHNKSELDD
jgi:hypothetical protein